MIKQMSAEEREEKIRQLKGQIVLCYRYSIETLQSATKYEPWSAERSIAFRWYVRMAFVIARLESALAELQMQKGMKA